MKRFLFAAAAAAALCLTGAAPALASNGPNPNTQSADNVHFTADYYEGTYSAGLVHWQCAGEHIDNSGQGGKVTEQETCQLSGPGTSAYAKGDYGSLPGHNYGPFPGFPPAFNFTWFSDYNGVFATTWSIHVNGDGSVAHVSATYPNDAG